jgi:hypothetical protein
MCACMRLYSSLFFRVNLNDPGLTFHPSITVANSSYAHRINCRVLSSNRSVLLYTQDENITVPQAETIRNATGARIDYICIILEYSRCGQGYMSMRMPISAGCSQSRDYQQKGRNLMEMKVGWSLSAGYG